MTHPPELPEAGTAAASQEKPERSETEYHVLRLVQSQGANETYTIHARNVGAASAKDAIRKSVTPTKEAVSYVAVPSRSFKLWPVSVKVTEQISIG